MKRVLAALTLLCLFAASFSACTKENEKVSRQGIYFDTVISLTVYGDGSDLLDSCFALCEEYDKLLSKSDETSDVNKLNSAGGKEVSLNEKTAEMISAAKKHEEISKGAFSLTLGEVTELWGFGTENEGVPDSGKLALAIENSKSGEIILNGNKAKITNGAKIDLGGFAKGYIADKIAELYKKENKSGIIDLGGNVLTVGSKPDEADFSIGIKDPENPNDSKLTVKIGSGSVVTSGPYERNFTQNGKLYHHLIDTETGYPAETGLLSVTIISPDSASADALSTAAFCLGLDRGKALIESIENTEAIFIAESGKTHLTSGLIIEESTIVLK